MLESSPNACELILPTSALSVLKDSWARGTCGTRVWRSGRDGVISLLCAPALLTATGIQRSLVLMTSNALGLSRDGHNHRV